MLANIIFLSSLIPFVVPFSVTRLSNSKVCRLALRKSKILHRHFMQYDDEEIFDAEEAVPYDAMDLSDSAMEAAVSERAVMIAYDMMKKKKQEFKEKVEAARAAEQQYYMMEQATQDLVQQYKEDPTKFKQTHSNKNQGQVAIEMLESVIADAAQKMIDIENSQDLVITQFYDLLEKEHEAEARAAQEAAQEKAANNRVVFIEEFNDAYEVEERRRDMAVSHAAHEVADTENEVAKAIADEKEKLLEQEEKLEKQLMEHKRNEEILKADLREIQNIVRDELLKEWAQQQEQKQQSQQGMM